MLLLLLITPGRAPGQEGRAWNDARSLELARRLIERHSAPRPEGGLKSYEARAQGYVYFYLDRRDTEERTLVKVNQVALELYWAAPDRTKQRIVGMRDEDRLPNRMYYHLDHLSVVQDEFGDVIRMGHGDEVRDVPHPAARGADTVYDYRLADSLTLRLPGAPEPIRLYELEVRPRRTDHPAIIGSVFMDRRTAEIVRMRFTFTPASYVDPRLDYIRVSLDNGLWEGRYWLPNEQRVELRRQVPQLDFPAGGVIRAVFRVGGYRVNHALPEHIFRGPRVVALPRRIRERHPFERGLYDGLDDEGLAPPPELETLEQRARKLAGEAALSGLPRLRLHLLGASSALRFNRAEGLFLGAGAAYTAGRATLEAGGGYAFGPDRPHLSARLRFDAGPDTRLFVAAYRDGLRDLGPRPGAPGALNTLAAAFTSTDFLDAYYATGVRAMVERRLSKRWSGRAMLAGEEHRSASLTAPSALLNPSADFGRPVLPVDDGRITYGRLALQRSAGPNRAGGWNGRLTLEAGHRDAGTYLWPVLELSGVRHLSGRRATVRVRALAGAALGSVPAQRLFLLGGPGLLPGYRYRGFVGDRFAAAELTASRQLIGPWVRLRFRAGLGWADLSAATPPAAWDARPTGGVRASVGAGLGLVYDILRVDGVRGLTDGRWQLVLSVSPGLEDIL